MKTADGAASWQTRRLAEFAAEVRVPFEPSEHEGRPYVGLEHIEQDTLVLREYGDSAEVTSTKREFASGDVLFGGLRPYFRKVVRPRVDGVCSTDITVVRPVSGAGDASFLKYFLAHRDFIEHASNIATGTRMPRANWKTLSRSAWRIPPLSGQRRIAAILSAYDDLIENSLRRIEILEEMARRLYREWFVEFRFPGHERARFVDSPLGRIPEGWEVRSLEDAAHVTMGQSPKAEFYNQTGDGLPFHQGVSGFAHRLPVTNMHSTRGTRLAEPGDLLFSVRAPVGRINVAACRMILGRGLCGIRHRLNRQNFLFHQLKERFKTEDSMGGGTIFKAVTKGDMLGLPFLVPNGDLELLFENRVDAAETLLETLTRRNSALRQARDLLLPRLVSGELDVSGFPVRPQPPQPLYAAGPLRLKGYRFFRDMAALPFVEKIVLFGSRARGDHESRSDIDLAVFCGGASEDDWLEVLACLREDRTDTLCKVDCVRFDEADWALRENVMTEGVVLYERAGGE